MPRRTEPAERALRWITESHHQDKCAVRYGQHCSCGKDEIQAALLQQRRSGTKWERRELAEQAAEQDRRARLFKHLGWRSEYAPARDCPHNTAVEVENEAPIEYPNPLPKFWFPIRLRHWVCADCHTAVNPHAFRPNAMRPLSEETQKAWWDNWRAYERSVNRSGEGA